MTRDERSGAAARLPWRRMLKRHRSLWDKARRHFISLCLRVALLQWAYAYVVFATHG